ncbi:MAG: transposase [Solibacillus sp.]|uniref:transposase n=1 Tax=Solibacillus sp. FSL H8-0523 TaxID=2954511 RepID=UPI003101537D
MGRKKRLWHPQYFDHVVMRGNNRQVIFAEQQDFAEFFRALHYTYDKYPFELLAYCLMNNHYHLLILSKTPLSKTMMLLNRRYSDYYKKKYRYSGHLYENRYYSDMVLSAQGILEVSRYIHQNPIRTKTPLVNELEHYPYSSFQYYVAPKKAPVYLNPFALVQYFPLESERTLENYITYCSIIEKTVVHEMPL